MDFKIIIILSAIIGRCCARDDVITTFVSSYILNEEKPTVVEFCDLCWSKKEQLSLALEIMKTGFKISTDSVKNLNYNHGLLFILDLDCPETDEKIRNISSLNLLRAPYRWLFLTNSESAAKEMLFNSSLLADSDVVLAERSGDLITLTEIHRPAHNLSIVTTPRGIFNGSYHDIRTRRELFRRRMDLMGHTLTMSNVVQNSNKTQYHLPREDGLDFENDCTTKINWMVGKLAFLMLNATPRFIFSFRYGYKVDGQWSGMIQDVHSGKADLGTNVVMDPERLTVVSSTDTLGPFRVRFIFRQPSLSYVANIYSLPFSTSVWLATALCAAISVIALSVASRWEALFGKSSTQLDGGMSDALFLTMSALSQQGSVMEPRQNSGRVAVWSVFATLMALHAAYSANIVTLLQAPSNSVATLSQLVNSKITLAAYDVDYNHYIIANSARDPVRIAAHKKIDPPKGKKQFYNLVDGVERIRQGLFAMHSITEQVYRRIELTFQENEKCDLMEIDLINALYPYAPMKRASPYLELMRVAFKRIRETGVNSALNRRHQTPKPRCAGHISSFSSVGAAELMPVLILMAIGIALAIAILCFELLVHSLVNGLKTW